MGRGWCRFSVFKKAEQMGQKLDGQPKPDKDAGDIGGDPTGVPDDLEYANAGVVRVIAALVKSGGVIA